MYTTHDKPLAAKGLNSYRYLNGAYGFVMIGARDVEDALHQAALSIYGTASPEMLQVWKDGRYVEIC